MKEWVISVIVSVFAFSVIGLLLPNGNLAKFIKKLFAVIMVFVLLQPLFSSDVDNENYFDGIMISENIQSDYLVYINGKKIDNLNKNCQVLLSDLGVKEAQTEILFYIDGNYDYEVEKVVVNLQNAVISEDRQHIDIIDEAKTVLANYFNIEKEKVLIYE